MAFEQVVDLDCSVSYALGGKDKKTGKANPSQAEGYYLGARKVDSKLASSGFCYLHVLQTEKGNVGIWGKRDMDTKLKAVNPGTMVRITFTGMQPTKRMDMYKYKVEVDKTNTIDVGGLSAETTGDTDDFIGGEDDFQEQSLDTDEPAADEAPVSRPQPPKQAAKVPDAAAQARVQALLNRSRNKTT